MASATISITGRQDDRRERGDGDVDDAARGRVLQAAVQRERLDEPGGVDLLDRDASEGALVEIAELEHGRRAVDVEQVLEQRQPVPVRRQDDGVDVVPADDLGELVELAQHRDDRVRVIADEADQLDAVGVARGRSARRACAASSPAPRPSTRSGRSVVCMRCWRTSQPATARKPIREAATSRRGSAPVSSRAAAATTSAVTSVAAWAWRTRRTASARWYSPRSRSSDDADHPRDRGRGERREQPGRRVTESDPQASSVSPYTASKGALKMLTRAMCADWARHGIQANGIGPGYFRTEMNTALQEDPEFDAWLRERVPAGRWGDPSELGGAVVFLASAASDFVNGQILYVDGGLLAVL